MVHPRPARLPAAEGGGAPGKRGGRGRSRGLGTLPLRPGLSCADRAILSACCRQPPSLRRCRRLLPQVPGLSLQEVGGLFIVQGSAAGIAILYFLGTKATQATMRLYSQRAGAADRYGGADSTLSKIMLEVPPAGRFVGSAQNPVGGAQVRPSSVAAAPAASAAEVGALRSEVAAAVAALREAAADLREAAAARAATQPADASSPAAGG